MTTLSDFGYRTMRAALLDPSLYEEVEADRSATVQALALVVLSSLAAGIGAGGWHGVSPATFALFSAIALISWALWALLTFQIGSRLMPEPTTRTTVGELLRTIGFAAAPGLLQAFAAFQGTTAIVFGLTWIWMLAAMVIAVRQALDFRSTRRALAVCALGWALALLMAIAIGLTFSRTVLSESLASVTGIVPAPLVLERCDRAEAPSALDALRRRLQAGRPE